MGCGKPLPQGELFIGAAHHGGAARGEDFAWWDVSGDEFFAEVLECARRDVLANIRHEPQIHMRVVDAEHSQTQNLVDIEQVP